MRVKCVVGTAMGLVLALGVAGVAQEGAGKPSAEARITLPVADLDAVVGTYSNADEPDRLVSIYRDGDHLYAEGERSPKRELFAVSRDRFVMDGVG